MSEEFDKQAGLPPDMRAEGPRPARDDDQAETDATTGASPGTAQACDDLGLNSLEANLARFNIKPPGVS